GNSATGSSALTNTYGNNNTGLGLAAGLSNTAGSGNTFIGANAQPETGSLINATAIGANAMVSQSDSIVLGSINGVNGATSSVKVGIGTATPAQQLDVIGNVQALGLTIPTGASAGKVLTSDANGNGTWQTPIGGGGSSTTAAGPTAPGSGLTGGGTNGSVNLSLLNTCSTGQLLKWNGPAWACSDDSNSGGTITAVTTTPGSGLIGGGSN